MPIPEHCTVLVVGGGPGGSYTAAALAREGIDTVLLEAEVHPRYHIGESMLPTIRHYLRFIDLDSTFDQHGFIKKVGAAFKLNRQNREGFTDFMAAGGPDNYSWNVIRSEADELLFRHAAKCGANTFDGVKVNSIAFSPAPHENGQSGLDAEGSALGRPVSASYTRKSDGHVGEVKFDYIVDASGRVGLLNTKYLKNRVYNQGLKNVANWGYWKDTGAYGIGTPRENAPYFEALHDESGWAWFIPLHDNTTSVGIVMNQELMNKKRAESGLSSKDFYLSSLKLVPNLSALLGEGELATGVKSASDYSYSSSTYAMPYARTVGDAGCFIDPFFSSGAHLAVTGALSAATTIAAAIKGDCDETAAVKWHTNKIREGYSRWLLVVLSAYKQMRNQEEPVLSDFGEDNFDRAFAYFKPVIQGTADVSNKLTQAEFTKALDFFTKAFDRTAETKTLKLNGEATCIKSEEDEKALLRPRVEVSPEEKKVVEQIRSGHGRDSFNIDNFTMDVIDGMVPRLERGNLGLVSVAIDMRLPN